MEENTRDWQKIKDLILDITGKEASVEAILFLIGQREFGGLKRNFTKEEKVTLMDIALKRIMSITGYYKKVGIDKKGFPVWEKIKDFQEMNPFDQELLIRNHIIEYFKQEGLIQ
ncbi:MAG: hypothetical protein CNE98_01710 [Bacteroidetes bacterium MED-G17]|mgnify:CR=1 FL=1|nr:MAG: hypothetical protein CBB99_01420 [Bacteroidetes bacterium TMED39]PDH53316.1 MAG: hypothetical protein CNE98_01710 [Bacteroidetes bacterium MED-G17]|tara:strand:+ start:6732 stop:7073 length:342 start_codon:yes stop_codon:yes gene_type:complete